MHYHIGERSLTQCPITVNTTMTLYNATYNDVQFCSVAIGFVSFGFGLGDSLPGREAGCGCLPSGTSPDSFGLCFAVDRHWSDAG